LNAIDGAGAPEGHILVMTTNAPDALDEALIRPGRVDMKLEFSKATRGQVKDIFMNMYKTIPSFEPSPSKKSETSQQKESQELKAEKEEEERQEKERDERLEKLAEIFAECVPEKTFSPAELQDYILLRKDQPQRAIDEIADWVAQELHSRSAKEPKLPNTKESKSSTAKEKKARGKKSKKEAVVGKEGDEAEAEPSGTEKKIKPRGKVGGTVSGTVSPSDPGSPDPESDKESADGSVSGSGSEKASEEGDSPPSSVGKDGEDDTKREEKEVVVKKDIPTSPAVPVKEKGEETT
jgi:chaperone BCS1